MKTIRLIGAGSGGADYEHELGSSVALIDSTFEFKDNGLPFIKTERWRIEARIKRLPSETLADLDAKITALQNALLTDYTSVEIRHEDGSTSAHSLGGANLIGGVRPVSGPSFTKFSGAELTTYRNVSYTLEGSFKLWDTDGEVISHQRDTDANAVGEIFTVLQPNIGNAVIQRTTQNQHSVLVQSGTITWAGGWQTPPAPLYSNGQLGPVRVRKIAPRELGNGGNKANFLYGMRYEYRFADTAATLDSHPLDRDGTAQQT